MMIEPSEISQFYTILEEEQAQEPPQQQPLSYDQFRRKISQRLTNATEKELYALYCYYYGKALWKIVVQSSEQGMLVVYIKINELHVSRQLILFEVIVDFQKSFCSIKTLYGKQNVHYFIWLAKTMFQFFFRAETQWNRL